MLKKCLAAAMLLWTLGAPLSAQTIDPQSVTLYALQQRKATVTGASQEKPVWAQGVWLTLVVTDKSGTNPTLNVKLQYYDATSLTWVDITGAAFAEKTDANTSYLLVYPGTTDAANARVNVPVPKIWRIVATLGGTATPTLTWSLGAIYLP